MGKQEECSSPQNVCACVHVLHVYTCICVFMCMCVCVCLESMRRNKQWLIDISVKKKENLVN